MEYAHIYCACLPQRLGLSPPLGYLRTLLHGLSLRRDLVCERVFLSMFKKWSSPHSTLAVSGCPSFEGQGCGLHSSHYRVFPAFTRQTSDNLSLLLMSRLSSCEYPRMTGFLCRFLACLKDHYLLRRLTFAQFLCCLSCLSSLQTLVEHVDHPLLIIGDAKVLEVDISDLLCEIDLLAICDVQSALLGQSVFGFPFFFFAMRIQKCCLSCTNLMGVCLSCI